MTGAARGTGEVIARLFAEEGAKVTVGDRLVEAGTAVADDIGDAAHFVELDVTDAASWAACVAETEAVFGPVDVLVNNAGVLHMAAIEDHDPAEFERCYQVNTLGPFLGMRAVLDSMRTTGSGAIVTITSIDSTKAKNGLAGYAASKWGARGLSKVAALEFGRFGIRVNTVCPEAGSGDMVAPYVPDGVDPEWAIGFSHHRLASQKDRSQQDRLRDVAQAVLYLASDEAGSTTGSDLVVDSGITAGDILEGSPGA